MIFSSSATRCSRLVSEKVSKARRAAATALSTRSEERRVGKECRSRCDWSSDVCSSDLLVDLDDLLKQCYALLAAGQRKGLEGPARGGHGLVDKIGRASCRERV